jgi:diguanylate cyclase (GGDEF)-like protein/PAS domain S-box-containing protein
LSEQEPKTPETMSSGEHEPLPGPRSLTLVSLGLLFVGIVLSTVDVLWLEHAVLPHATAVTAVVAVVLGYLHVRPQRKLTFSKNIEDIQLDEVLFVPMLVLLPPAHCLAIIAFASLASSIASRRELTKAAFNLGQLLTATATALLIVRVISGPPHYPPSLVDVVGGMTGSLTITAMSAVLVRGMVAYASGQAFYQLLLEIRSELKPWFGAITLGGVGTLAIVFDPLAAVLVVILMLFVQGAYASSMRELAARREAESLQDAVAGLRSHSTTAAVLDDLTRATQNLLAAAQASPQPIGAPVASGALTAPLSEDLKIVVTGSRSAGGWTARDHETLSTLAGVARDVLRSTNLVSRLRALTNSQSEAVFAVDLNGRVTFANPAAVSMIEYKDEDHARGQPIDAICRLRHAQRITDLLALVRRQEIAQDVDATLVRDDGDNLEVAYSLTPLLESDSHTGAVLVLRDVTERRALQNAIAHRALHDELTGLPNRRLLLDRLDHAMERLNRGGGQHAVLFFDLDRFKLINDSFGHLAGDQLLVDIANRLRESISTADTIARFSGDEFVVLVEDVESTEDATKIANRMLEGLEPPFQVGGTSVYISASIGVTMVRSGHTRDEVLASADRAAYLAKAAGRNNVQLAADNVLAQARTRLDVEAALHRALESQILELHFQPIIRTDADSVVGVEALVRWPTKDRGLIKPEEFIPVAEDTGLIHVLGGWVLSESARTVQRWTANHPDREPLRLSVNVSPRQFTSAAFTEKIAEVLQTSGLDPHQLCLEITESVLMTDSTATLRTIHRIRDLGVRVAVDDFGIGYSSLSYLKRFPIDIVKLDKSFTGGLGHDVVDAEIVATVLRLTEALGIETVAEGVETPAQRKRLGLLGCQLMQGFLASRPLSEAAFLTFWGLRSERRVTS